MVNHTLKISEKCKDAIIFLREKGIKPDRFFREGGEKKVLEIYEKYNRQKLIKKKDLLPENWRYNKIINK